MPSKDLNDKIRKMLEDELIIRDPPFPLPPTRKERIKKSIESAKELDDVTKSVIKAQKLYAAKGFNVEIKICRKTGLVLQWKLKNKYQTKTKMNNEKLMTCQEFESIFNNLDDVFSSRDIINALIGSGIGPRRLQPTLGDIVQGNHPGPLVEKTPGAEKGPGVRYRKVK